MRTHRNGILRFPFSIFHLNGDGVLTDSESRFAFALDCGSLVVRDADGTSLFSQTTDAHHLVLRLKPAKGPRFDAWKFESVDAFAGKSEWGKPDSLTVAF